MTFLVIPVQLKVPYNLEYRLVGPSETKPTPSVGYIIVPQPIEIENIIGKFWLEYKLGSVE